MSKNVRAAAAKAISLVTSEGKAFTGSLDNPSKRNNHSGIAVKHDDSFAQRQDQALYREICYGTLRHYFLLSPLANRYLKKAFAKKDNDVYALILSGFYQLLFMRIPQHAALDNTVSAATKLKKPWAKGVVNAVLRAFLRENPELNNKPKTSQDVATMAEATTTALDIDSRESPTTILSQLSALDHLSEAAAASHPDWLYEKIGQLWPESLKQIVSYNNQSPPMSLRVNLTQGSREVYLRALQEASIDCFVDDDFPDTAITLNAPCDVFELPLFAKGGVSVQDVGAQYAAQLLQLQKGQRVLDACAAPGGKSAHILESCSDLALTSLDISADRLERVADNLARIQRTARLQAANAVDTAQWWDGEPFDRILLDAPCSGTGVISHHPDIKLLRRPSDIDKFQRQQFDLLTALWPTLKPSGLLLYCTCSIMDTENQLLVAKFLSNNDDAKELPLNATWGVSCTHGRQLLPNRGKNGGFYYALLSKYPKL